MPECARDPRLPNSYLALLKKRAKFLQTNKHFLTPHSYVFSATESLWERGVECETQFTTPVQKQPRSVRPALVTSLSHFSLWLYGQGCVQGRYSAGDRCLTCVVGSAIDEAAVAELWLPENRALLACALPAALHRAWPPGKALTLSG